MPTIGTNSKPAYVYDAGTDTWIPIGPGEHTHDYIGKDVITTTGDIIYASAANTPARLGIGSSGEVLSVSGGVPVWAAVPASALPAARARQTVVQSLSNNTITKITFTAEDYDTHNNFASSTFTASVAGYYMVNAQVNFDSGTSCSAYVHVYKNGANETNYYLDAQAYPSLIINTPVYLAVNDTVEIYANQQSGSSKNTGNGNRSMYFAVTGIRS